VAEFQDFPQSLAGFEQPLEFLRACHERVRRMVEMLIMLREHLRDHGADAPAVVTAGTIRCYFEEAWPQHLQDEELELLPRLRARLRHRTTVAATHILETIDSVLEQHLALDPLLKRVVALLEAIEAGTARRLDEAAVQAFVELYRIHIALEEDVLAPAFARHLTAADLRDVGRAMAARRGAAPPAGAIPG
jgi:hemerythrin-like domain-containing protein